MDEATSVLGQLIAVMLLGLTAATAKQNHYWSDPEVFYKRTLKYSPDSARMHTYLDLYYQLQTDSR